MLEDAEGINCQASNFSRAFSGTPQGEGDVRYHAGRAELTVRFFPSAAALGLLVGDDNAMKKDYASIIQKFNRWLTTTLAAEDQLQPTGIMLETDADNLASADSSLPHISQVMALQGQTESVCLHCRYTASKRFLAHVVDLVYPRKVSPHPCRKLVELFNELSVVTDW